MVWDFGSAPFFCGWLAHAYTVFDQSSWPNLASLAIQQIGQNDLSRAAIAVPTVLDVKLK